MSAARDDRARRLEAVADLIAAADKAPTVRDALLAALAPLCAQTRSFAGRLSFVDGAGSPVGAPAWHSVDPDLDGPARAAQSHRLQSLPARALSAHAEWDELADEEASRSGARSRFSASIALSASLVAQLEFFSTDAERPADAMLDLLAFGGMELGRVLRRRPVDEALRRSESEYRALFENARDGFIIADPESETVLDANASACAIYGWTRSEFIGLALPRLWDEPSVERSRVRETLRDGQGRFESAHWRSDETQIVVEVSAGTVAYHGQRALWMSVRDITEQLRMHEQLAQSEARYRSLFESSPHPMWVSSEESGRFLAVNEAAVRRYGYSREQFSRMEEEQLAAAAPAADDGLGAPIAAGLHRHRTATGETMHVEMSAHGIGFAGAPARLVVANDVTERTRAEGNLWHAAFFDALTGLPNRARFLERLKVAQERATQELLATAPGQAGRGLAVLFLDLDRFKVINDSLGHRAGDVLLVQIARRLERLGRQSDTIARLGGDEFAMLFDDVPDAAAAARVAERVHRELSVPFDLSAELGPAEVFSSASIGIVFHAPGPVVRPGEELLRDADIAMYRAKSHGAGHHALFDVAMHDQVVGVLQMESDLRRAIDREELRVFFQPIVALPDERIVGFEALCRWPHRVRGSIPPSEFIPLAEETGLIGRLDRWVLEEACAQMRDFQQIHAGTAALTISVNLSGRELLQADLAEQVAAILERTGLAARSLRMEITESVLVENELQARRSLSRLKELGVSLCLDDFGTGFSSLSYLHQMPVDALKIDVTFVRTMGTDEKNRRIIETILLLGKQLGLEVVAEGVETLPQAAQLSALGCERAQGFLFGRPFDAETARLQLVERAALGAD